MYLNRPEKALILAVDKKSIDRTAIILPVMPGIPARMAHDYVRRGTTSLFAAMDVASGRFHLHFTPTSSSWMNLAGRWFAELTNRKLCHSARRSVTELEADIGRWITPEPFVGQDRRRDPRHPCRLLPANQRLRTMGHPGAGSSLC